MLIFNPLFTILALLMGGYVAKRLRVLKAKQSRAFLDFTITFALPCLIFDKTYHLNFDLSLIFYIGLGLFSCILAGLLCVLLGFWFKFSKATLVSMFLLASFGNTLFIGIPIISAFYKEEQFIGEIILYDALATALPMALFAPFIIALASDEKVSFIQNLKKVFLFPPFIALALGFCLKIIPLPSFIFEPIRFFGNAATPVALFAIGLWLGFNSIKSSIKSTLLVLSAKMLFAPLIFICLALVFNLEFKPSLIVAIFESAMPTMTLAGILVIKAKLDSNLAISVLAFGVILAFFSMPFLLFIFAYLGVKI
ncbi:AEC family transporter [Campylobacter sp. MIT 97-5078]|uniref:AEC family transporter n=1 Tax=Campylobacter sp. MIT 97-5078 TaxID=1548153 RepID=UPI000513A2B7|nr:AEC family transporter [Campylobacter sp. MIT 97-5078]KGI56727.1 membrane protein [Campylobacter sp. MIT 97-5078]KGI57198.1 membrane protein [Campylobacter sp. MIT 97-5078]TQR27583.1 AEC family transporter [Campylobacter sp. MIT 97-5078]